LSRSLRWLSFEAISYQFILLGHQFILFGIADRQLYGLAGTLFSLVYLCVTVADLGLEPSLSPFFAQLTKNRQAFGRFLVVQFIPNVAIIGFLFAGLFCFLLLGRSWFASLGVGMPLLAVLGLLTLTECIKKTLRAVLHLAFLNRATAFIGFGTIVSYIATVWGLYGFGFALSLPIIFVPMLVTSSISMMLMIFFVYKFYRSLPQDAACTLPYFGRRVIASRGFNALNQLSHLLFSSNFLVPFFAFQFGLAHAGLFKLVSHIAYCTTGILRRTFGVASDALLAKSKAMAAQARREVFTRISERLHHALYGIFIFFVINHTKLLTYGGVQLQEASAPLAYLFLLICLSENFFIAYEKFYIMHEKAGRLLFFNVFTMILTYGVIHYAAALSQFGALLSIVAIRVTAFVLLSAASFYTWHLRPAWRLRPKYLAVALGGALGFFVLF